MPRFTPVIRVKEKAIPALTKDRWHPTSLADEASDAKPLLAINYLLRRLTCRKPRTKAEIPRPRRWKADQLRKGAWPRKPTSCHYMPVAFYAARLPRSFTLP